MTPTILIVSILFSIKNWHNFKQLLMGCTYQIVIWWKWSPSALMLDIFISSVPTDMSNRTPWGAIRNKNSHHNKYHTCSHTNTGCLAVCFNFLDHADIHCTCMHDCLFFPAFSWSMSHEETECTIMQVIEMLLHFTAKYIRQMNIQIFLSRKKNLHHLKPLHVHLMMPAYKWLALYIITVASIQLLKLTAIVFFMIFE